MEFSELSKKRESVRNFTGASVKRQDLEKILEAGRLSPSGCNLQPWHLYVVEEGEKLEALKQAIQFYGTNLFTSKMGAAIVIVGSTPNYPERVHTSLCGRTFYDIDCGLITANMELCATDMGLGSCAIGCFNEEKVKEVIGVTDGPVKLILALGIPESYEPRVKTRKNFEDIVTFVK